MTAQVQKVTSSHFRLPAHALWCPRRVITRLVSQCCPHVACPDQHRGRAGCCTTTTTDTTSKSEKERSLKPKVRHCYEKKRSVSKQRGKMLQINKAEQGTSLLFREQGHPRSSRPNMDPLPVGQVPPPTHRRTLPSQMKPLPPPWMNLPNLLE